MNNPLSWVEVKALIAATEELLESLLITLMCYTGLRSMEIAGLKIKDVDTDKKVIWVRKGMGKRTRTVPYSRQLDQLIDEWLKTRKSPNSEDYFFVSHSGGRLSMQKIWKIVHEAAKLAGIQEVIGKTEDGRKMYRVRPWTLRKTFAVHAYRSRMTCEEIELILGHKSPKTTIVCPPSTFERTAFESYHAHFDDLPWRRSFSIMTLRHDFAKRCKNSREDEMKENLDGVQDSDSELEEDGEG